MIRAESWDPRDAHTIDTGKAAFDRILAQCGWQNLAEWMIDAGREPEASAAFGDAAAALSGIMTAHFGERVP